MTAAFQTLLARPWIWSFVGAGAVWLAAIAFTGGYGAGGMLTAALSLSVFTVIVGVGQMFVITLGPGNIDLSLPANIGLASAVAMKTMGGDDRLVVVGLAAAIAGGLCRLHEYSDRGHTSVGDPDGSVHDRRQHRAPPHDLGAIGCRDRTEP